MWRVGRDVLLPPSYLFRGTIGDMMQKLSGQLSGARNKGEPGDWALGKFITPIPQSPGKPDALLL